MPPHIVDTDEPRPGPEEGTPQPPPSGVRPRAAGDEGGSSSRSRTRGRTAPRTPPPSSVAPDFANLRESLVDFTGMIGVTVAGFGYGTRNPGLALAGFNVVAHGEQFADSAITASKKHPKLRRALETFTKSGALAVFIGEGVAMIAPIGAALVPHPALTMVANRVIMPEAHAMALEAMPDLFVTTAPNGTAPDPAGNAAEGGIG